MASRTIATLSLATVLASAALMPSRAQTFDPNFLDRMAEERNAAKTPGKPIVLPPTLPQVLSQPRRLLICMNVPQWAPILAAPRSDALVIGRTTNIVAATTNTTADYAEIVPFASGRIGYVSKSLLTPFRSVMNPGAPCTVAFALGGRVVFQYR